MKIAGGRDKVPIYVPCDFEPNLCLTLVKRYFDAKDEVTKIAKNRPLLIQLALIKYLINFNKNSWGSGQGPNLCPLWLSTKSMTLVKRYFDAKDEFMENSKKYPLQI